MNKLEIIKTFLEDDEIMEKYHFSNDEVENLSLSSLHQNSIISLVQHAVGIIENETYTTNTAAANLNSFLENRLRGI
jgi:hypothetical protein